MRVDSQLAEAAQYTAWTKSELVEVADALQYALQSRFTHYYESSKLSGGSDHWLVNERMGTEAAWLAFTESEIVNDTSVRENVLSEYDREALNIVLAANLLTFQELDYTIEIPGTVARQVTDPFYYAIWVPYPESWHDAQYHTFQQFQKYINRYEMSTAEALDYWVTEIADQSLNRWAASRGVGEEAVRKNRRQAQEKLSNDELGATHSNGDIQAVPIERIPDDDPHNEDEDMFYTPELTPKEVYTDEED